MGHLTPRQSDLKRETDMTIHAATTKSAAAKGIALAEQGDLNAYSATLADGRIFHQSCDDTDAPSFLKSVIAAMGWETGGFEGILETEAVRIEQASNLDDYVARLMVNGKPAGELARDPILSDLLDTLDDEEETMTQIEGIRSDSEEDEEEERTGSVVPDAFKKRYAEAGHPGHCGDWLALNLNALCQTLDGKKTVTDLDRLEAIANANGVAPARVDKLGTATNGWQGRYRMTVRNMLAKVVADKGFILIPEGCGVKADEERKAPADWCLKYATKAKVKAAPKAAVTKDEGTGKASAKTKALAAPKAETPAAPVEAGTVSEAYAKRSAARKGKKTA